MSCSAQQDLDIDLAVRAVDAGRVIDEVCVDATAIQAVFDSCKLCQAEVAALTDDVASQIIRVDPNVVVALVADIGVALGARLDVSADAAVP